MRVAFGDITGSRSMAFEKLVIKGPKEQTLLQIVCVTVRVGMQTTFMQTTASDYAKTEEEFRSLKDQICSYARRAFPPSDKGHGAPRLLALR